MTTLSALTVGASAAPNEWTTPGTSPMEVIASAVDTSYGEIASNAAATLDQGYELNAVPADLGNVDDLSVRIRYFWAATPNGLTTWDTLAVRIMSGVTVLAAADAGGTFKTLASSITTTTPTNTTLSAFAYVNTGAAKSLWDAAVVEIRQISSKTKGGDTTGRRVSAFEVSGNYTIGGTDANVTPAVVTSTSSIPTQTVAAGAVVATTVVTSTSSIPAPTVTAGAATWDFVKVTESYVSGDANQTSCSITRATHGSTAGNLLVGAVSIDKDSGTITPPTGWTAIYTNVSTSNSTWVGWRVATGDTDDDFAMSWVTAVGNSDTHVGEWYAQGITPALEDNDSSYSETADLGKTVNLGAAAAAGRLIAWACIDSDKISFSFTGVTEHANEIGTHLSGFGQSVGTFGSTTVAASDARSVTSAWQAVDQNYLVTFQFVESSGNVTVTPAVVTSTGSVGAPTVAAGAALTATIVTSTGSVGAPTVSTGTDANVTTTVVTSTGSVGAVTVAAGAALTATIVTSTSSVPAPTVSAGGAANVTTTVVTSTGSVGAPTIAAGAVVTPAVVTSTSSVGAPTIAAGAVVAATTVTSTGSVGAPTVAAGAVIAATVVTSTGSVGAPSVSTGGDATVTATVVTSTGSVGAPTVTAGGSANVTATVVTSTSSVGAPTVAAGAAITATVVTSTSSVGVVTVTGDANVSVATVTSTSSVQTVGVAAGVSLTATVVTSTSSVQAVSVSAGASVSPTAISSTGSVGASTVTIGELLGVLLYGMIVAWSEPRTVVGSEPAADAWSEPGVVGHGNPTPTGEAFDAAYDEAFG